MWMLHNEPNKSRLTAALLSLAILLFQAGAPSDQVQLQAISRSHEYLTPAQQEQKRKRRKKIIMAAALGAATGGIFGLALGGGLLTHAAMGAGAHGGYEAWKQRHKEKHHHRHHSSLATR